MGDRNAPIHIMLWKLETIVNLVGYKVPTQTFLESSGIAIDLSTPEKFENAALFLRLGLPSTLIRHENEAFRKRSSNRRNLKTPAFFFV